MKNMGTIIYWLLVAALLPVVAFAQTQEDDRNTLMQSQKNQSENLSQFRTLLRQEQERSSFLD